MPRKKLYREGGIVYSTAVNLPQQNEENEAAYLPPGEQRLQIVLDKKHRGGKVVSIVKGLEMNDADTEAVAKKLKVYCGTGGTVKDKEIIIQGDHRDKVLQWLRQNGYSRSRKI